MKRNILFVVLTVIFFLVYFKILQYLWNAWIPYNTVTDILSIFLIIVVIIPLSLITTNIAFKFAGDDQ